MPRGRDPLKKSAPARSRSLVLTERIVGSGDKIANADNSDCEHQDLFDLILRRGEIRTHEGELSTSETSERLSTSVQRFDF